MNDYQTILSIGEHNSTYTVSSTKEGLEFKKTRLNHPVKNAKASFQKVKLRKNHENTKAEIIFKKYVSNFIHGSLHVYA